MHNVWSFLFSFLCGLFFSSLLSLEGSLLILALSRIFGYEVMDLRQKYNKSLCLFLAIPKLDLEFKLNF